MVLRRQVIISCIKNLVDGFCLVKDDGAGIYTGNVGRNRFTYYLPN